jgi:hypothetical protein
VVGDVSYRHGAVLLDAQVRKSGVPFDGGATSKVKQGTTCASYQTDDPADRTLSEAMWNTCDGFLEGPCRPQLCGGRASPFDFSYRSALHLGAFRQQDLPADRQCTHALPDGQRDVR